jgi:hypothetical protein
MDAWGCMVRTLCRTDHECTEEGFVQQLAALHTRCSDRSIGTSALGLPALAHLLGNLAPEATQLLGSQCFVLGHHTTS